MDAQPIPIGRKRFFAGDHERLITHLRQSWGRRGDLDFGRRARVQAKQASPDSDLQVRELRKLARYAEDKTFRGEWSALKRVNKAVDEFLDKIGN